MNPEILGDRLRKAREHARMSQVDAAQQLDVTPAALSQYEAGKRRVDALLLDKLSRIYGVPVRFFFGEQGPRTDWEETLRVRAEGLSSEGKAGISSLITKVQALEELFEVTGSQLPQLPHPPFPALPDRRVPDDEAAERAEQVRRHFDLGMAPLQNIREFLDAIGFLVFAIPFGSGDSLSGHNLTHPTHGRIVAHNE
jgi:transcriptional regulator with XRE-family HTH domain